MSQCVGLGPVCSESRVATAAWTAGLHGQHSVAAYGIALYQPKTIRVGSHASLSPPIQVPRMLVMCHVTSLAPPLSPKSWGLGYHSGLGV